ncbi:hypothetical protein PybrP1_002950 [[Pythium] brassicae (nom. inval.)]|nr:hypothetical protein PybrP1_002950 [[Pythium] brassicae (nom. inval.)]
MASLVLGESYRALSRWFLLSSQWELSEEVLVFVNGYTVSNPCFYLKELRAELRSKHSGVTDLPWSTMCCAIPFDLGRARTKLVESKNDRVFHRATRVRGMVGRSYRTLPFGRRKCHCWSLSTLKEASHRITLRGKHVSRIIRYHPFRRSSSLRCLAIFTAAEPHRSSVFITEAMVQYLVRTEFQADPNAVDEGALKNCIYRHSAVKTYGLCGYWKI